VRLLAQPQAAPAALKRAALLVWYEVAEPSCLAGVSDLQPFQPSAARSAAQPGR
jgi:hypothetical protein